MVQLINEKIKFLKKIINKIDNANKNIPKSSVVLIFSLKIIMDIKTEKLSLFALLL